MTYENKIQRFEKLKGHLDTERQVFVPLWRELSDYLLPTRARFLNNDHGKANAQALKHSKIIDSTATLAVRTLRAGMMSGLTSPARPWFQLETPDSDLNEHGPVKQWLHTVTQRMRTLFHRSNLYNSLPTLYGDMGVFGTGAMAVLDDPDNVMRCYTFPVGSYWLALNDRMQVDTFIREFSMTVRQLVTRFGDPRAEGDKRWANFSPRVKRHWEAGEYEVQITVINVIQPNPDADPRRLESKYKPFRSCYYEKGIQEHGELFLRESGYDVNPIIAPRWDVTGEDVYGSSPGMVARGDVKALQLLQKRKAQAVEKQVNPPLQAPSTLMNSKVSQIAGDVTYVDMQQGKQGITSLYNMNFDTKGVILDIQEHQYRIKRAFYEDLFLMLAQSDRREITAREVDERHEEKLLALGPVLERLNDELLDPLIDVAFQKLLAAGELPEAPEELEGMDLKVEYVSIMAQAQKMVGLRSVDRFLGVVGQMAQVQPNVLDKVDTDQVVDEYGDMTGMPPRIIRTDEQVADIRERRAQAQQAAQRVEQAAQLAQGAKTLSETDTTGDNALTRVLAAAGAA